MTRRKRTYGGWDFRDLDSRRPSAEDWLSFMNFLRDNPDVARTLGQYSDAVRRHKATESTKRSAQGQSGNASRWALSRERAAKIRALAVVNPRRPKETQNHYLLRLGRHIKPAVSPDVVRRALKK